MQSRRFLLRFLLVVSLTLGLILSGCTGAGPQPAPEPPQTAPAGMTKEAALAALEQHLQPRIGPETPRIFQYRIGPAEPFAKGFWFRVDEFQRAAAAVPYLRWEVNYYAVTGTGAQLVVGPAAAHGLKANEPAVEVLEKNGALVWAVEGKAAESVIALAQLPTQVLPRGASPGQEFGVGKAGFGSVAVSPTEPLIALTTRGTHPLFALYNRQTKQLKPLDLWYGGGPGEMAWSLDGKYLAVTVASPSGAVLLQVWEVASGEPRTFKGMPTGPEVQVQNPRWVGEQLKAEVNGKTWTFFPQTGEIATGG